MREQACWRSCYFKIQCLFGCLMTTCSAARFLLRLLKCIINVLPSSVGKIGTHTRPVVGYVGRCLFCIFKVSKIWFNLYLLELFLNTRQFSPYQPVMIIKARQSEAGRTNYSFKANYTFSSDVIHARIQKIFIYFPRTL